MMSWYIPPSTSRNRASASELMRLAKRCGGSSISLHSGAVFSSNPLASRIGSRSTLPSSRLVMWRTLPSGRVPGGLLHRHPVVRRDGGGVDAGRHRHHHRLDAQLLRSVDRRPKVEGVALLVRERRARHLGLFGRHRDVAAEIEAQDDVAALLPRHLDERLRRRLERCGREAAHARRVRLLVDIVRLRQIVPVVRLLLRQQILNHRRICKYSSPGATAASPVASLGSSACFRSHLSILTSVFPILGHLGSQRTRHSACAQVAR